MEYRQLTLDEIDRELLRGFVRHQTVDMCRRKIDGEWRIVSDPFTDDWDEADYCRKVKQMRATAFAGGLVLGALENGRLKGFAMVEPQPMGKNSDYLDLSSIHVSEDMRGKGIGRELFLRAKAWAGEHGARKLYISAHSAVESQAFYRAMGCVEAEEYDAHHVADEPCDCQMECIISRR